MTESEKRSAQKVDPFLYNIIECMCEQFRPHKRKDGKELTYSCSSCDRITKSGQFPYITEDFTICSRCCEEDKAWKVLSEKAKLMSEGYSEEEALKKAIDEFGKDLPDMRDGEDLT